MFSKNKITLSALVSLISSSALPAVFLANSCAPAKAQFANTQGRTIMIPAGTTFEGRIDTTLSSKKSHSGDRFNVTMSSPVLANGSDVLIAAGSQVIGEVVEAISSGQQPHQNKQHLNGKLRVQITALKVPDGTTYPLVASFIGETTGKGSSRKSNPDLGTGVAYIGSTSNFNAVYPSARQQGGNRKGPQLVTRKQMMDDPLYGDPDRKSSQGGQAPTIRSLVKDHYEIYIHEGAPMSIRLDAPLKIAIAPIGGMSPSAFNENAPATSQPARPNFSRPRSSIAAPPSPTADAQQQEGPQAPPAPVVPTGPAFLEPAPGARAPMIPASQSTMQQQSFAAPAAPQAMPSSAPQGGGWFRPPSSPAEQAAAAQATPSFSSAPAAAQSQPATYNSFSANQAAPLQSAPVSQTVAQPTPPLATPSAAAQPGSLFGDSVPPPNAAVPAMGAAAMPAMGSLAPAAQAAQAQSMGSLQAPSAASAPAAAAAAMSMPQQALPILPAAAPAAPPPPAGQSLDTFINSLGGSPAAGATAPSAVPPKTP